MRIPKISLAACLLAPACGQSGDTGDPTTDPQAALDHHGDVAIEMLTADNQERSPFEGTQVISISLDYLECLVDFYAEAPEWRQDGPQGGPVFDAWLEQACAAPGLDCAIASIEQNLDVSPPRLTVRYEISGDPEGRTLQFGPLPDAELAGCEPIVRLGRPDAIHGEDAEGERAWSLVSFNPDKARTDQGQAITIRAGVP